MNKLRDAVLETKENRTIILDLTIPETASDKQRTNVPQIDRHRIFFKVR